MQFNKAFLYFFISLLQCLTTESLITQTFSVKGSDAVVRCVPTDDSIESITAPIYRWFDSDGKISLDPRKSVVPLNGDMRISRVTTSDSGRYDCQVSTPNGDVQKTFKHFLTVYVIPDYEDATFFDYHPPVCNKFFVESKTKYITRQLCQEQRPDSCQYTVHGNCTSKVVDNMTKSKILRLTIKSTVRGETLNDNKCQGQLKCLLPVIQESLLSNLKAIKALGQKESLRSRSERLMLQLSNYTKAQCTPGFKLLEYRCVSEETFLNIPDMRQSNGSVVQTLSYLQSPIIDDLIHSRLIRSQPHFDKNVYRVAQSGSKWYFISIIGGSIVLTVAAVILVFCCMSKEKSEEIVIPIQRIPVNKSKSRLDFRKSQEEEDADVTENGSNLSAIYLEDKQKYEAKTRRKGTL